MSGRGFTHHLIPRCLIVAVLCAVTPRAGWAASVLIFGDRATAKNQLGAHLTDLGESVTLAAALPLDLTPYSVIWHVSAFTPLSPDEQQRLIAYLGLGRGLHLTGERPCCEPMNDSLEAMINQVVIGGGVQVGGQGDPLGPYTFNAAAPYEVTTTPVSLSTWTPTLPGGMAGVALSNVLISNGSSKPVGAAWGPADLVGGKGRLTILMDADWFTSAGAGHVIANLQTFLVPAPHTVALLAFGAIALNRRRRSGPR